MVADRKGQSREEFGVFKRYIAANGFKHSRQREVILERFLEAKGHLTVDELYRLVRRNHPEIGRTTIYRTLKLLCDAELAEPIELKDGITRYEHRYQNEHHDHIICTQCGTILEFTNEEIELLQKKIAAAHGFTVDTHRHQIFGVCATCQSGRGPSTKSESRTKKARAGGDRPPLGPTPPLS